MPAHATTHLPAGGCDNGVKMWNLATNQQQQVAQHAAPVRHAFFIRQVGLPARVVGCGWGAGAVGWAGLGR